MTENHVTQSMPSVYLLQARMACSTVGTRIAQLVKAWISILMIAGWSSTAGWVFFCYGPLASLSLHISNVGSNHHAKKWAGVKITPRL